MAWHTIGGAYCVLSESVKACVCRVRYSYSTVDDAFGWGMRIR